MDTPCIHYEPILVSSRIAWARRQCDVARCACLPPLRNQIILLGDKGTLTHKAVFDSRVGENRTRDLLFDHATEPPHTIDQVYLARVFALDC